MRGRKPKPTYLKILDGNPGRRPNNPGEPQPPRRAPTCPSHLCPAAKAEWKRLAAQLTVLRILTELDRAALAAYCQAYGRWVEAERKLHETPIC
jgi:phage terminase small subunit